MFVDMGQRRGGRRDGRAQVARPPAWLLARSYHLAMMPGIKRKLRLLVDWNVELLFGRDASELGQLGHPASLERTRRATPAPPEAAD